MTRRDIDDETSNLALPAGLELCGQDLNMPVPQELGLGIELVESTAGRTNRSPAEAGSYIQLELEFPSPLPVAI